MSGDEDEVDQEDLSGPARSKASPRNGLKDCIEYIAIIHQKLGSSQFSRAMAAEALGHKGESGASTAKIASMVHFGLFDRSSSAYRISKLAEQILIPTNDAERVAGIAEAARRPRLYNSIYEEYVGKALPTMLGNILVRNYGVLPKVGEEVATRLRETFEFSGLLRAGIVVSAELSAEVAEPQKSVTSSGTREPVLRTEPVALGTSVNGAEKRSSDGTQEYTIPLGGDGKVASIKLPLPVNARHMKKVAQWVAFMQSVLIDDDGEEKSSPT